MVSQRHSYSVKHTGFTTLQEGGNDPDCDIIFIHGLNGKPDKSWTYSSASSGHKKKGLIRLLLEKFTRKKEKDVNTSNGNSKGLTAKGAPIDTFHSVLTS